MVTMGKRSESYEAELKAVNEQLQREIAERQSVEAALRRRNRDLAMLNQIGQLFTATLELEQLLPMVLERVRDLLNITASSIWLLEEGTGDLVCWCASGPSCAAVSGWRVSAERGVVGRAARTGHSSIIADTRCIQDGLPEIDERTGVEMRSILAVPLRVRRRLFGVLLAVDTQAERFLTEDLELLELLSAAAMIAVENAQLYAQARRDAATKSALLNEIDHRVKNNLCAIVGLLYAERRHSGIEQQTAYQAIMQDLVSRVEALATVHDMLSSSQWSLLNLSELATRVIRSALQTLPRNKRVLVRVSPSEVLVAADQAQNLALVINELATNTLKYALKEQEETVIEVGIEQYGDVVQFLFRNDGPGYPEAVLRLEQYNVGFGLVQNLVRVGLRGDLELYNDNGPVTVVRFSQKLPDGGFAVAPAFQIPGV